MNRWRITGMILFCVLLIAVNLYLLLKKDSVAHRVAYIKEWWQVEKGNVTEKFQTKGVVIPHTTVPISVDPDKGVLETILVGEGDLISPGTPLYTFSSDKLEEEKKELESTKLQLQGEIDSVEAHLSKLESYQSSLTFPASETNDQNQNNQNQNDQNQNNEAATLMETATQIERDIYEEEQERDRLQQKLQKIETELSDLQAKEADLTVTSQIEGYVVEVDQSLTNPIITIASTNLAVKGQLTEVQRAKMVQNLAVSYESPLLKKPVKGMVLSVSSYPEKEPSIEDETIYSFISDLKINKDDLYPGSKVNVSVVVKEAKDVVFLPKSYIKKGKQGLVYALDDKGYIVQNRIEKGISSIGKIEVKKGVKEGDRIVKEPQEIWSSQVPVITPLQDSNLMVEQIKKMTKTQWAKYIAIGMLDK
ncbi:efflux RND transporter periplasmic adaptor subunit [Peribacillus alkalitolerans]|uniref:efflux RND transporter periplasmic adaptor subunit n=1 Tax=Peribacillus alkalitolerans TaxID=1550385 RepID=UPI0013D60A79|nr:efflux RND transporter periplasmic adaptor subunit [Peribacillus alkalitolerans]